jgi:tetratricopeptide (TPR) repeat protein
MNVMTRLFSKRWLLIGGLFALGAVVTAKLAEQCSVCLEARQPHAPEALLPRGHVLQNLHRFKDAELLARELVARRGLSFDYGLLGDVLMEQGRLDEAVEAYQRMVNEKPDMQAYARIAHLRWLKGDLGGAIEAMEMATAAASPNAPEAAAWVNSRLALLRFQNGDARAALGTCEAALNQQKDYPPALLLRGRLLLAEGRNAEAVEALQRAARLNPLPDYQWVLSEALRAAGRNEEAQQVENELARQGAISDPRTFSLYLASRGTSPELAVQLAQNELKTRGDVFTHDALAWALAANGRSEEAWQEMQAALAEGTRDARLFFHATAIAAQAGHRDAAQAWLDKAAGMKQLLLPSERRKLENAAMDLARGSSAATELAAKTATLFTSGNEN